MPPPNPKPASSTDKRTIGWREWVVLPDLGIGQIKAKVDTGARSSALHAFALETYAVRGGERVRFLIHPLQRNTETVVACDTAIADRRTVTDSGGHREMRIVIVTTVTLGDTIWPIEMTLTDRDSMGFRMLLGRTAMHGRFLVDPARSYRLGKRKRAANKATTKRR